MQNHISISDLIGPIGADQVTNTFDPCLQKTIEDVKLLFQMTSDVDGDDCVSTAEAKDFVHELEFDAASPDSRALSLISPGFSGSTVDDTLSAPEIRHGLNLIQQELHLGADDIDPNVQQSLSLIFASFKGPAGQ